jgi:uncharacterized membrane protein YphA (DoxX/SURF4 family)
MSLLRFTARTLLASYFVINGAKAVRHPGDFTDSAQPVIDKVVPALKAVLPAEAAGFLPEDASGVARTSGVLQIVGGLSLATGIGRRLGASILAVTMAPQVITNNPRNGASGERAKFGADAALLGGVILAALDTEGEPDLAWKLRARRQLFAKQAARRKAELAKNTEAVSDQAAKRAVWLRHQVQGVLS